jgi:predicted O-methyltransferase YrrM
VIGIFAMIESFRMRTSPPAQLPSKWLFIPEYFAALWFVIRLFGWGWLKRNKRYWIQELAARGGFHPRQVPEILPEISFQECFGKYTALEIREPESQPGNMTCFELTALCALVRKHQPKTLFEIGTFDGRTTLNLAASAGPTARVWTLDLPAVDLDSAAMSLVKGEERFVLKSRSGERYLGSPYEKQITQVYGDSAVFDFTPYHGKVDFVFIDGSHAYEYVESDTENALKLFRPEGGLIVWHDYGEWPGVTRYLNRFSEERKDLGATARLQGSTLVFLHLRQPLIFSSSNQKA